MKYQKEVNHRTLCTHGTSCWALFSACAFTKEQILLGNEIKLTGMLVNQEKSHGANHKSSNLISTVGLLGIDSDLSVPLRYAQNSSNTTKCEYETLKDKFLKKYTKRNQALRVKLEKTPNNFI
ncbi:MAG: hypothetical protein PV340_01910 [Wolbachia sp.]|nr:hypothetical protein [Wolbachia sp.]MDD9336707.1 hypothetical protein [Wolbachia sp.]